MSKSSRWTDALLEDIKSCPVFSGMKEAQVLGLIDESSSRLRTYGKGDMIAQAGEEVHFLQILLSGSVKGEMIDFAGKVIKIEDILPPRPLATAFLFGSQNRYPVNITAREDCQILAIPKEDVLRMMQKNKQVLKNFLDAVSSRSQFLSSKIRFLSFTTIKGKLAQYLLDLQLKQESKKLRLPHSQNQLSELFGVARPSIGRAISEMNRDGLIRAEGKQVTLLDLPALRKLLD